MGRMELGDPEVAARLLLAELGPEWTALVLAERLGWDVAFSVLVGLDEPEALSAMWNCLEQLIAFEHCDVTDTPATPAPPGS